MPGKFYTKQKQTMDKIVTIPGPSASHREIVLLGIYGES